MRLSRVLELQVLRGGLEEGKACTSLTIFSLGSPNAFSLIRYIL